jgi:hypothetical protein
MLNFAKFFLQGIKNTLRVQNGVNFAYKGPWVSVFPNTVIDEWYMGDFMAAEYTIVVDVGNFRKEIIKALVVAGPETANVTVYGRTNLGENLIDLAVAVNTSRVQLIINPANSVSDSSYDDSAILLGAKAIFSATYYHTINDLTSY